MRVEEGRTFGPWKVVGRLGQGGMGQVFLVERKSPKQMAALKLLPTGERSPDDRRRFRREHEILSRLEHPNIVRVLDAGESEDGEPYLVLEKVDGEPIDVYVRRVNGSLQQRLELFLDVCRAVVAAHSQLFLHCDLKPSNILVREDGVVKLLDFSLARPVDAALVLTALSSSFSTLAYASPEQLAGKPLATTSDVYSLGVLLFEIVVGRRPFDCSAEGVLPTIEARLWPPKASAMLDDECDLRLRRAVEEDLDFVIGKAMRPESLERYGSVEELIADLEALIGGFPVAARLGDRGYEVRRFARRHSLALALAALLLASVLAATLMLGLQARRLAEESHRAGEEQKEAERIAEYLLDLFESARTAARERRGTLSVAAELALAPESFAGLSRVSQANLSYQLSNYFYLARNQVRAEEQVERAVTLWQEELGPEDPRLVQGYAMWAILIMQRTDYVHGCALAKKAVELSKLLAEPEMTRLALKSMGLCQLFTGQLEAAERTLLAVESLTLQQHRLASREMEKVLYDLADLWRAKRDLGRLETTLERGIAARRDRRGGYCDPVILNWEEELTTLRLQRRDLAAVESSFRLLDTESHSCADLPPSLLLQKAEMLRLRGQGRRSLEVVREAIRGLEHDESPDSPKWLTAWRIEAMSLFQLGLRSKAKLSIKQILPYLEDELAADDIRLVEVKRALSELE